MTHITHQVVASIITNFQQPFDTHEVEMYILRNHPEVFARELLEFIHTGDPLHQFSAQFGKWIDNQFQGQIIKTQKVKTNNLAGQLITNQQWRRINPATPVN
jgi:hypothetical protein